MSRPDSFREIESVTNADAIRQLSCSEALRNTGRKLRLFTPALLVTHGGFDRDPVQEFDARYGLPEKYRPVCIQLKQDNERFFEGLGVHALPGRAPVNWDQRLYAIDEQHHADCFDFIGGISFSDPRRNFFASVLSYDLLIPDPTSRRMEFLQVRVFGVLANTFAAYLQNRAPWCPAACKMPFQNGAMPPELLKHENMLIGGTPKADPLQMREGD
jgi:hypothetical protein